MVVLVVDAFFTVGTGGGAGLGGTYWPIFCQKGRRYNNAGRTDLTVKSVVNVLGCDAFGPFHFLRSKIALVLLRRLGELHNVTVDAIDESLSKNNIRCITMGQLFCSFGHLKEE